MASVGPRRTILALSLFAFFCWQSSVAQAQDSGSDGAEGNATQPATDRDEPALHAQPAKPKDTVSSSRTQGEKTTVSQKPAPVPDTTIQTSTPDPTSAHVIAPKLKEREFRFDALRIAGTPGGPEALLLQAWLATAHSPLLKTRRSFLYRVLETVEMPALHSGR
jgi:hypothetical protein